MLNTIKQSNIMKPLVWTRILVLTRSLPAVPSQEEKHKVISEYARKYGLNVLVETGTYRGDTVEASKVHFKRIFSIELEPGLYAAAKTRFADSPNISILEGNSGTVLPQVTAQLTEPALFWLDGHWSGQGTAKGERETPIEKELGAILQTYRFPSVILIDDARCFLGSHDYPTVGGVKKLVKKYNNKLNVKVKRDIIRISPSINWS